MVPNYLTYKNIGKLYYLIKCEAIQQEGHLTVSDYYGQWTRATPYDFCLFFFRIKAQEENRRKEKDRGMCQALKNLNICSCGTSLVNWYVKNKTESYIFKRRQTHLKYFLENKTYVKKWNYMPIIFKIFLTSTMHIYRNLQYSATFIMDEFHSAIGRNYELTWYVITSKAQWSHLLTKKLKLQCTEHCRTACYEWWLTIILFSNLFV